MTTIYGGIFNFTGHYIPPAFSGGVYNFTHETPYILYQIYSDKLIYAVTSVGLKIFDSSNSRVYAYINYSDGFTTVGGNSEKIYLGTTNYGIKYLNTTCISGSVDAPYDLSVCLVDLYAPRLTSSGIRYLHVNENKMTVCTNSGVDYFSFNTNPEIHSRTFISSAEKCFTTNGSIYYTVSGISYDLNRLDTCLCDWVFPTKTYTTGSGIFQNGLKLTDMYVTEETAEFSGNTVFCTTTSGAYVIDEDSNEYAIYYTR